MVFSTTNFCFLSSALLDCLVLPLQEKMEEWNKVTHSLDKELKKKTDNQNRLVKKHNKKSQKSGYCTFVACLNPVLGEEISMVSELQQLAEVMNKLDKHTEDPFKLPEASEQVGI